ncbi:MAG: homoserine O-acetyltransferase [Chitinophagaceae bacterium]|nr:homoserine O-acetyltransferase [Chitinophagaceae bacterium]
MLESGQRLSRYHLAYHTYGRMNAKRDNVIWIFHALTANSAPHEWWQGLVGEGKLFDPSRDFIVCANVPGSCYGSLGPLDNDVCAGQPYYYSFPMITTRDIIRSFQPLRKYLGIEKIRVGIGGSLGGQQLLEWAIEEPSLFENIIPIATNAFHSPWGIAFNTTQRMAIEADGTWGQKDPAAGMAGMKAARAAALLSYRSYEGYGKTQPDNHNQQVITSSGESDGGAASYQRYQGQKLAGRFNAFSYYQLSKTMDSHHVGRDRDGAEKALASITANTLVVGIDSDVLFPLSEQQYLAEHIPGAQLAVISSLFGHDGFLLEYDQLASHIFNFISKQSTISIEEKNKQHVAGNIA